MALLSGFGCISSPWQTFGVKPRLVTEADISRAQAGLDATTEMLDTKRTRLRIVEKKIREKVRKSTIQSLVLNSHTYVVLSGRVHEQGLQYYPG